MWKTVLREAIGDVVDYSKKLKIGSENTMQMKKNSELQEKTF